MSSEIEGANQIRDKPNGLRERDHLPPEARRFIKFYRKKKHMKKADKDLAKTIISLCQGFDGSIAVCELCNDNQPVSIELLTIHHPNGDRYNNDIHILEIAHGPCNSSEDKRRRGKPDACGSVIATPPVSERDHTRPTRLEEKEYTSREGEKHDLMRVRWNAWIHDPIDGPFKGQKSKIRINALAKMAPHALGMGSSVTYRRYIEEDYYGGIFDYETDDAGYKFVIYLGPKKEKSNPV